MSPAAKPSADLPRVPASDVKRKGWRGVMRTVRAEGAALITNHDQPEAVILPAEVYEALLKTRQAAQARTETDLMTLRRRFDDRLAVLTQAKAGDRLRSVMRGPSRLRGRVKAGTGH
jgi:PHD/YefM family antitoxin component YafN of YafNO toxin-antitoxin module